MSLIVLCTVLLLTAHLGNAVNKTECGPPQLIDGAVPNVDVKETYAPGEIVEFSCDFGYVLSGYPRTLTCIYNNQAGSSAWTEPDFRCVARACGEPGYVSHARRVGAAFTFPNKVTYICDEGYKLKGSSQKFCQANGEWSGRLPSCERIECETPSGIANGRAVYESLEYGSKLQYICNKGYSLDTAEERICLETGLWSGKEPACLEAAHCPYPNEPLHGTMDIVGGKPKVDSIVIYQCEEGYILHGSRSSKCLSSGDWSFEPPICLDTCKVPDIEHGRIGVYETKWRRKTFVELEKDTVIEDGKEIHLRCATKYEPPGGAKDEVKISCSNGKWSLEPVCKPASCKSQPPKVPNAQLHTMERDHGTTVTYLCNTNYKKTATGSVKCNFGTWIGEPPVCTDTRCSKGSLKFSGHDHTGKQKYRHNEVFIPKCTDGFELSKPNKPELKCVDGVWQGQLPPCKPASCSEAPQSPKNGRIVEYTSNVHGSTITIACNTGYYLPPNADQIRCLFGQWESVESKCQDTRCYSMDLRNYEGVDISTTELITLSGDYARISCLQGYVTKFQHLQCSNGVWKLQNNVSPCQPGSCTTHYIQHGDFRYAKSYQKYNWLKVRYDTVTDLIKVADNVLYKHGAELYVRCSTPFVFQGKSGININKVRCSKEKWHPVPICLRAGESMPVETTTTKPHIFTLSSRTSVSEVTTVSHSIFSSISTTNDESELRPAEMPTMSDELVVEDMLNSTSVENLMHDNNKNCTCIYTLDDDAVIAFAGAEKLEFNSKVKIGSTVQFSCRYIGHERLIGASTLKCETCEWHSSYFPTCVKPVRGDPIMDVDTAERSRLAVSSFGVIAVPKGSDLNITCFLKDVSDWPSFRNLPKYIEPKYLDNSVAGEFVLVAYLSIKNIDSSFNGKYECWSKNGNSNHIEIEVSETNCPDIVSDTLHITYSNKQEVHSKVFFDCLGKNKVLVGEREAVCLSTGKWSGVLPVCQSAGCPAIKTPEEMNVIYTEGRKMNSQAIFSCAMPYVLRGSSMLTCLANGKWTGTFPACVAVSCSVQSLMDLMPENVVPKDEQVTGSEMPYGSVLSLECDSDTLYIIGPQNATCTKHGSWSVGSVSCIQGCAALKVKEGSELIIEPTKEFYKFGEFVTFSCPPGLELSGDVERLMCLNRGWSDEPVPACKPISL